MRRAVVREALPGNISGPVQRRRRPHAADARDRLKGPSSCNRAAARRSRRWPWGRQHGPPQNITIRGRADAHAVRVSIQIPQYRWYFCEGDARTLYGDDVRDSSRPPQPCRAGGSIYPITPDRDDRKVSLKAMQQISGTASSGMW